MAASGRRPWQRHGGAWGQGLAGWDLVEAETESRGGGGGGGLVGGREAGARRRRGPRVRLRRVLGGKGAAWETKAVDFSFLGVRTGLGTV